VPSADRALAAGIGLQVSLALPPDGQSRATSAGSASNQPANSQDGTFTWLTTGRSKKVSRARRKVRQMMALNSAVRHRAVRTAFAKGCEPSLPKAVKGS
jgi:hypothetical protein